MKDKIKAFIVGNFLFGNDEGLNDDTSFLDEGIIASRRHSSAALTKHSGFPMVTANWAARELSP